MGDDPDRSPGSARSLDGFYATVPAAEEEDLIDEVDAAALAVRERAAIDSEYAIGTVDERADHSETAEGDEPRLTPFQQQRLLEHELGATRLDDESGR